MASVRLIQKSVLTRNTQQVDSNFGRGDADGYEMSEVRVLVRLERTGLPPLQIRCVQHSHRSCGDHQVQLPQLRRADQGTSRRCGEKGPLPLLLGSHPDPNCRRRSRGAGTTGNRSPRLQRSRSRCCCRGARERSDPNFITNERWAVQHMRSSGASGDRKYLLPLRRDRQRCSSASRELSVRQESRPHRWVHVQRRKPSAKIAPRSNPEYMRNPP